MKKIIFLHSSSELYGSDRSLYNLIKNLDKNEFKCIVILPEDGPLVNKIKSIDKTEVIIKEIAVLRRKNLSFKGMISYVKDFYASFVFIKKLIKENDIDIVYTNTSVVFPGAFAAKFMKRKNIWHVREIIESRFERKIVSSVINIFADIIIANSKATGKSISKNEKKLEIIYNAIEDNINTKYEVKPINKEKTITIGMAGRINRWKGQKLFVDMARLVLEKNKNTRFLIAGDVYKGEFHLLEELKNYIKENNMEGHMSLLGRVEDMTSFYDSLDVFVLPSIQPEPFGLVVIEAMDRMVPVVATNHGGPVEIIQNNKDGFLVDYKNAEEMSEAVLKLINDEKFRKEIVINAKAKRSSVFSLGNYVRSISEVLKKV